MTMFKSYVCLPEGKWCCKSHQFAPCFSWRPVGHHSGGFCELQLDIEGGHKVLPGKPWLFPTCQVRVVRFYQSSCPPPPPRLAVLFLLVLLQFLLDHVCINFHLHFRLANSSPSSLPTLFAKLFANFPAQCAPLDLNLDLPSSACTAGPQPGTVPAQCVHRWTSAWGLPSSVRTAGPQPGTCPAQRALLDLNRQIDCQIECQIECQKICQKICQNICQKICQIECQKICQIECQKICQIECQRVCQTKRQNVCQIECQKVCQRECQIKCQREWWGSHEVKYFFAIPWGHQTWQAGKSPVNEGFNGNIIHERWSFHCHVWLPDSASGYIYTTKQCFYARSLRLVMRLLDRRLDKAVENQKKRRITVAWFAGTSPKLLYRLVVSNIFYFP